MVEFAISKVRGYLNSYAISVKIIVKNDVVLGRLQITTNPNVIALDRIVLDYIIGSPTQY